MSAKVIMTSKLQNQVWSQVFKNLKSSAQLHPTDTSERARSLPASPKEYVPSFGIKAQVLLALGKQSYEDLNRLVLVLEKALLWVSA